MQLSLTNILAWPWENRTSGKTLERCNLVELQDLLLEGRLLFSEVEIAEGVGEREQSQRQ